MKKYEIEINYIHFETSVMIIGWSAKGIGFGQLTVYNDDKDDKFIIDTECMSDAFRDQVLEEAIEFIVKSK